MAKDRSKCKEKAHPAVPLRGEPDMASYDAIVVSTSGGKDSVCALDVAVQRARQAGVLQRLIAVHAILHDVEWPGVLEIVQEQADFLGVPVVYVETPREKGTWLDYAIKRKEWPGFGTRFCTRGWKADPINKVFTEIKERAQKQTGRKQIRFLSVMGMRADESAERACLYYFSHSTDPGKTNSVRWTDDWLPIHSWNVAQVWDHIHRRKLPYHPIYDQGMARLSCVMCPLAGKQDIVTAAALNPEALAKYVEAERQIGKPIKPGMWLRDVQAAIKRGKLPVVESTYEELYCWQCPGMPF